MRTIILLGTATLVGVVQYCKPTKTITETVEVEVEVVKEVTVEVPTFIETTTYVDRPVLVFPNIEREVPSVDWNGEMLKGVKFFEGFKSQRYKCCAGVATIGYGCTDATIVSKGSVSKSVATKILESELAKVRAKVRQAVKVDLTENQLNALTSFAFNCGMTNLNNLINGDNRLNDGNYKSIEHILPQYRKAGGKVRKGLEKRRAWELALWKGTTTL